MSTIIQLSKPVSRDAVIAAPAKDFSQAYIMHLNVNAEDAGPNDSINIVYCPFDKESGERLMTEQREISVPFWQVMEEVPKAADAFKAVCDALPLLIAHKKKEKDAKKSYSIEFFFLFVVVLCGTAVYREQDGGRSRVHSG